MQEPFRTLSRERGDVMKRWGTTGLVALAMTGLSFGVSAEAQEMPGSDASASTRRSIEIEPVDYRDYYAAEGAAQGDPGESSPSDAPKTSQGSQDACACTQDGCCHG